MNPDREKSSGAETDGVGRNAAFALGTQIATATGTAALTLYLVRALGPAGYGTFAIALGVSGILMLPADFGISASAGRFIAERLHREGEIRAVVAMAARLKIAIAALVAAILFLLSGPIADAYGSAGLTWPLRAVAIAMFGQSVMQLTLGVFMAVRKISRSFAIVASESAMELTASVALVLLGAGATGAAFGRAAGYLFGAAIGLLLVSRFVGAPIWRTASESPVRFRQFMAYAGALMVIDGAYALFNQIDVLIIGGLLGTAAAGFFSAPMRLVALLSYPGLAAAQSVAPRLANQGALDRSEVLRLQGALRGMIMLQVLLAVFVLVWARPIVDLLLGSDYGDSVAVLRAISPFVFMLGLGPLVTLSLNYAGHARRRVPIAIAAVAANAAFDFAFIPSMGIVAAALGTVLGYAIYIGWHLRVCRSVLGLALGPLALRLLKALAAAVPTAAVLYALETGGLGPLEWIVGLIAGPSLMAAALLGLGEVSRQELSRVAAIPRRLTSRK